MTSGQASFDQQNSGQDQGSFLNGFVVGLFAGAAGYFLFATDRGHSVREELAQEWQQAKSQLNQVTDEVPAGTLRQALTQVAEWLGFVFEAPTTEVKTKSKIRKSGPNSTTTVKKSKFKGT